jgi:hypothetical protein
MDTLHRSAALLALGHSEADDESTSSSVSLPSRTLISPRERPLRSLKNTKHLEFVARPTEIKLADSGEVWKGVIMTNPKNRNENDVGFSWNVRNQKQQRKRFGRWLALSASAVLGCAHTVVQIDDPLLRRSKRF